MTRCLKRAFLLVSACIFLLCSCSREPANEVIYHRDDVAETRDSACNWLADMPHFHQDDYYQVFTDHYTRLLKLGRLEEAAAALAEVTEKEMYFQDFRDSTFAQVQAFRRQYGKQLPWHQTLFMDSYTGNYYIDKTEFRKAIPCFARLVQYQPFDYNTCTEIAHAYGDMAFCYSAMGEHAVALPYNLKALALFNLTDNLTGKGGIYDNLALIHLYTKNYAESELYFNKAMQAYREIGDTTNMFTTLHNKILLYEEIKDPRKYVLIDSAYHFFMASGREDPSFEVAFSTYYIDKLLHDGHIGKAKAMLDSMKLLVDQLDSPSADADYLLALAQYELKTGVGIANTAVIEQALQNLEEDEALENQVAFAEILKKDAALKGDYKKALAWSEKEKAALSLLSSREVAAKTMELNKAHEAGKREQHILLQQRTISNKNVYIVVLILLLVAFVLGALVIDTRRKQKKAKTESQQALLYTRQLLEKTEEERRRIASDLHDSVSHELLSLKNTIHTPGSGAGAKIDTIINDIRSISRNLHPIMFEKVGLEASIGQLVERTQAVHDLMVTAEIDYNGSLPAADELQVYRIIQEALSNIIKYAEAYAAKIIIRSEEEGLYIEIKDNGKGFVVADKLASSSAFGLHNILERSKAIGGQAKIFSDKTGTRIQIDIKKHL